MPRRLAGRARLPGGVRPLQKTPQPWTRADVVYVASLVGGIFGKGGGAGVRPTPAGCSSSSAKFGADQGPGGLRRPPPAERPRGADHREQPGRRTAAAPVDPTKPGVALPDLDGPTAPGTGADAARRAPAAPLPRCRAPRHRPADRPAHRHHRRAAGAPRDEQRRAGRRRAHRATGKPLIVFGPQTGYFTPQLLTEEAARRPRHQGPRRLLRRHQPRRPARPRRRLRLVGDQRRPTTSSTPSWSGCATPTAGRPTVRSEGYLDRRRPAGRCDRDEHDRDRRARRRLPGAARRPYRFLVLRTGHGIVQQRTTVDGRPVAVVLQRSTYGHEVDSALGFGGFNDPGYVHDAASFQQGRRRPSTTRSTGSTPTTATSPTTPRACCRCARPASTTHLPRWGDATYDWQGWLPFADHAAPDRTRRAATWSRGTTSRARLRRRRRRRGATARCYRVAGARGPARRARRRRQGRHADVTGVMAGATVVDSRALYTLPSLLDVHRRRPEDAPAPGRPCCGPGSPRRAPGRPGPRRPLRHEQAASRCSTTGGSTAGRSVAYDVLRGTPRRDAGGDAVPRCSTTTRARGSARRGTASPGTATSSRTCGRCSAVTWPSPDRTPYCGGGTLAACRATLRASLRAAVTRVLAGPGRRLGVGADLRQAPGRHPQQHRRSVVGCGRSTGRTGRRSSRWSSSPATARGSPGVATLPPTSPEGVPVATLVSERIGQFFLDGDRLEYTEYGAGDRWVVLMHGQLMPRRMHQPLARAIAAEGFHVVTVDLLGHGRSDRPTDPQGVLHDRVRRAGGRAARPPRRRPGGRRRHLAGRQRRRSRSPSRRPSGCAGCWSRCRCSTTPSRPG